MCVQTYPMFCVFFSDQASCNDDLFKLALYMARCCNMFFRLCRGHGVFLRGGACKAAKCAGMEMNATRLQRGPCLEPLRRPSRMWRQSATIVA